MHKFSVLVPVAALSAFLLIGCGSSEPEAPAGPAIPIGETVSIDVPLGLLPVPVPADNPPTTETIALGRKLFYDKALSIDNTVACASCHTPDAGFADLRQFSVGVNGGTGDRQAPPVMNAAYFGAQFWDGRSPSLEDQAGGPVQNPAYVAEFEAAWGPGPVTYEKVAKSIASFERTVLVGNSPFDRYLFGDEKDAMSEEAIRGLELFRDPKKGNCEVCHTINEEEGYALLTDNKYHNLGVGADIDGSLADDGRAKVTDVDADRGAFKTPHLRNIADSGPYMHDGHLRTLKEVLDFYIGAGNSNDNRDEEIHELDHLTGQGRTDLVAFMEALSGEYPDNVGDPGM